MSNPKRPASTSAKVTWVLLLFSLPFVAVGVFMAVLMVNMLITWHNAQSWTHVPARILRTDLESHHGSKGGTSYQVTADYSYEYNGHKYTSHRVGLSDSGGDNIGSFQQDAYLELSQYKKSGKPFRCYINPANPEQSLLYRELRPGIFMFHMVFVLGFGGIGLGLMIAVISRIPKQRACAALIEANPEKPWMWKPDWAAGQIVYSPKKTMLFVMMAAVFWNLISSPLWFLLPNEIFHNKNYAALFGLLFPAFGLVLIVWTIVSFLQWRKFGISIFRLDSVPGVIGVRLAGIILTSAKIHPADGFHLTLSCVQEITTGSGKQRSTEKHTLWLKEQIANELLDNVAEMSAIPVVFQIPDTCRPTDETNANDQTRWRLKVTAKEPGIHYSATFEVPMFKTPQSAPEFIAAADAEGLPKNEVHLFNASI
ncbi:MAG: DUF3592 domain-containing protein [Phycisphaerales bacterium]|nr:DUF3592 domain-containing protein [Phycisphaerales bacterium]